MEGVILDVKGIVRKDGMEKVGGGGWGGGGGEEKKTKMKIGIGLLC